jgi:hypothetical protein
VLAKAVAQTDRESIIAIVAPVLEDEVAVDGAVQRVPCEAMDAAFLYKLQFQKNGRRQFLLQADAPI